MTFTHEIGVRFPVEIPTYKKREGNMICKYCDINEAIIVVFPAGGACASCSERQKPHTCPYKEKTSNDSVSLCTCSVAEQHECQLDIAP